MRIINALYKTFLFCIALYLSLHFLKDITQDILGIPSILDRIGNIQEDISRFPVWFVWLYHWAWVNAFLFQPIIVILVARRIVSDAFSKVDILIVSLVGYITVMTLIAYVLSK